MNNNDFSKMKEEDVKNALNDLAKNQGGAAPNDLLKNPNVKKAISNMRPQDLSNITKMLKNPEQIQKMLQNKEVLDKLKKILGE